MEIYNGQMKNKTLDIEKHRKHHKKKNGKSNITLHCNSILTFDIEATSAWLENGKVIGYKKGHDNDYWNNLIPLALPYLWQFSCDGEVFYGREFKDFINVLNDLNKNVNYIIWVHNLSYEFQFLSNIFTWHSVFARTPHKPMKAVPKEYPNVEFRCSYILTRLSLEAWGKQLGIHKLTGNLDYEKIRTPLTELTKEELDYGERDCLVVEAGIKDYIKRYGKQRLIPLTQTGTVRLEVKNRTTKNPLYVKKLKKLVPQNADEYKRLQDIFAGGYTHANRLYAGLLVEDEIEHYDFVSSYPTVMIAEKYPMSAWAYIGKKMPNIESFEKYAYIMKLKFSQLNSKSFNTYIQASKVKGTGMIFDNGRIIKADELEMVMTEQDFITISNNYEWNEVECLFCYRSKKDYLPIELTEYILELYANKTELKDVDGKEDLYLQSKQYINSMFGMCVTAIVQADVEYNDGIWNVKQLTREVVEHRLEKLKSYNPREKRYFLSYSWGCWVTAYARRNLWKCIESVDSDVIYCDTDSIFVRGKNDFQWYNNEITEKLKKACYETGLDYSKTIPKTVKGIEKPLGIFTKEENCIEFITLGAKRYVERREDGKLYLTVSGINKQAVALLENNIENFKDGFNFDKDSDFVTKRLCTYINDMSVVKYDDGYVSTYKKGINLRRTGYLLTMTDEYKKLIDYKNFNTGLLTDEFIISMRGRFK